MEFYVSYSVCASLYRKELSLNQFVAQMRKIQGLEGFGGEYDIDKFPASCTKLQINYPPNCFVCILLEIKCKMSDTFCCHHITSVSISISSFSPQSFTLQK